MKQTAVEFIETELRKLNIPINSGIQVSVIRILEQAKEMEKEQIIDAYYYDPNCDEIKDDGEQYYNDTYGTKG